jgi:hypothetical protein
VRWRKLGLIFEPRGTPEWMTSHAADPIARRLEGDRYRIYFCARDSRNRSQIGWFEIDIREPRRILRVSEQPFLALGPLGAFDDCGVLPSWFVEHGGREYHFFSGLTVGASVPFHFFVGLAVSDSEGTVRKLSAAPLLERCAADPYLTGSPCVLIEGALWRMWYTSGVRWEMHDGSPRHYYHIKYAESSDGLTWRREGHVCVDFKDPGEYVVARPCVLKDGDLYRMWYSYRGASYRIGYAESTDGLRWVRKDEAVGIDVSSEGWDSETIEYANVFDHDGERFMLYNGNGYGKTGIGLAVLDR